MSRRRKSGSAGSDFFAFQDIVTSTTGILLIITLLMALSIGTARFEAMAQEREEAGLADIPTTQKLQQWEEEREERQQMVEALEQMENELAQRLAAENTILRKQVELAKSGPPPDQIKVFKLERPALGAMSNPLTLVAQGDRILVIGENGAAARTFTTRLRQGQQIFHFEPRDFRNLHDEIRDAYKASGKSGVLMLVKPSAFAYYDFIYFMALCRRDQSTFPFSLDLVDEDWVIIP